MTIARKYVTIDYVEGGCIKTPPNMNRQQKSINPVLLSKHVNSWTGADSGLLLFRQTPKLYNLYGNLSSVEWIFKFDIIALKLNQPCVTKEHTADLLGSHLSISRAVIHQQLLFT